MWLGGPYSRFWRCGTRTTLCLLPHQQPDSYRLLLCDDTFWLPLVSTDWWVTSESMNRLGYNPRSKPYEQLHLFSNQSWCTFLRLRVLLLSASTVPSKLDASRITGNYNACCYKNGIDCVCVCVGGGGRPEGKRALDLAQDMEVKWRPL